MLFRNFLEELSEPWYLTVVRTEGILFTRPEKSWRPVVSIAVVDPHQAHEVSLGCDGQNPNTKVPITLHNVNHRTRVDVKVSHKSHKHRKKQHLVAWATVSLGELAKRQERPGSALELRLSCPVPQKKSPTIKGRQQHHASLLVKLHAPKPVPSITPVQGHDEDTASESSSPTLSDTIVNTPPGGVTDDQTDTQPNSLRRRRPRIRGYTLDTDEEDATSISGESSYPTTPQNEYLLPLSDDPHKPSGIPVADPLRQPDILPRYSEQATDTEMPSLSFFERALDRFAPYTELRGADSRQDHGRFDKVLARLQTEWYVVAASLLALAGIDAAIFGLAPGSIFPIDGFAQNVVAVGAAAAGCGLFGVCWLVFLYSNADAEKFQRIAKDLYGTYFFFCLGCRLPTLCMLISAVALTIFLLTVAWTAWPSAVLVFSFFAGIMSTLQYLVFGCHRVLNLCIWCVRGLWRAVRGPQREVQPMEGLEDRCNAPDAPEVMNVES